ncbi:alpha beta-hydrolase [Pyrrhoderma noxium]|uniref:Alpha beta-hydrolase n=1 Tax=Pyrrhoderma noxium TaxID=2282107 RepID=A0A286UL29_9AGAM|nr:alpha beta-hydrolase [Pyrrhoderma noxium]
MSSSVFERLYYHAILSSLLVKVPYWLLRYLIPSSRPRSSWTIRKTITVLVVRFLFTSVGRGIKIVRPFPTYRKLETGRGVQGIYVDGIPELVTGKLKDFATQAGVKPVRIPCYWIQKKGLEASSIPTPETASATISESEKVVLYLHGGSYVHFSAHPEQSTSSIPKAMLRACPKTAGAFPSALLDALAGYAYLINSLGYKPEQVVVAGDSAGGNLGHALVRYLVEYQGSDVVPALPLPPGALCMFSPWVDMSGSHSSPTSSVFTNAKSDYIGIETPFKVDAPPAFVAAFGERLAFETPYLSPACKVLDDVSFKGFPKTFITAGDAEVLLDQIRIFKDRITKELGPEKVFYLEAKDACHDWLCFPFMQPENDITRQALAKFLA